MGGSSDRIARRQALKVLGSVAVGGAAVSMSGLVGCVERPQGPQAVRVPLEQLPEGRHVKFALGSGAVDVVQNAGEILALSLSCTHLGCQVKWFEDQSRFKCPCHDGIYDSNGKVLAGPPPRSLDRVPVRIEGREVVIGFEEPSPGSEPTKPS